MVFKSRAGWILTLAMSLPVSARAGTGTRVVLEPSDMPPTRTICEVTSGEVTSTVEWDAASLSPLRQTLVLPPSDEADAKARVRCWSRIPPFVMSDAHALATSPYWVFGDAEVEVDTSLRGIDVYMGLLDRMTEELSCKVEGRVSLQVLDSLEPGATEHSTKREGDSGDAGTCDAKKSAPQQLVGWIVEKGGGYRASLRDGHVGNEKDPLDKAANAVEFLAACSWTDGAHAEACPDDDDAWTQEINEARTLGQAFIDRAVLEKTLEAQVHHPRSIADHLGTAKHPNGMPETANITVSSEWTRPRIEGRLHMLDTALSGASSNRSLFNPVPEAVTSTLSVLGDIALKRAEARTREVLVSRITEQVCDEGVQLYDRWVTLGVSDFPAPAPDWSMTLEVKPRDEGWEVSCTPSASVAEVSGQLTYRLSGDGIAVDSSSCGLLEEEVGSSGSPNLTFTAPTGPPKDDFATLSWRRKIRSLKPNTYTKNLDGGRHAQTFGFHLEQTCAVVKDRPFADLARSGSELARALQADLLQTAMGNLARLEERGTGGGAKAFHEVLRDVVAPLLETAVPVLLEAAKEGRAPSAREAQAMLGSLRQRIKGRNHNATRSIELGLAVLADCIGAGACDLRQVAAKIAKPSEYYSDWAGHVLPPAEQQLLVGMVDDFYTVFAPDSELSERQRASGAVAAMFDAMELAVRLQVPKADRDEPAELVSSVLQDMRRISLASLDEDLAQVAIHSTTLVTHLVQLAAHDRQCNAPVGATRKDERWTCSRGLSDTVDRLGAVLPWLSTMVAHSEQIKDERNGDLTEEELADNAEARRTALEELIDSSTGRKDRSGDWVFSLGANVGFRFAREWSGSGGLPLGPAGIDGKPLATTPLTLSLGLAMQRLPAAWARPCLGSRGEDCSGDRVKGEKGLRDKRDRWKMERLRESGEVPRPKFGVGLHLQASPVDLGQFVNVRAQQGQVTWNEFLIANVQLGMLLGTSRDAFSLAVDYRYLPAEGFSGAHQIGAVLTYYVPFFDLNR